MGPVRIRSRYDVVIVGAGPAGCAAAAGFARRGASVLLVESNPGAAARFAGEWIHPEGVRVLRKWELLQGLDYQAQTRGFAVFPNDGLGLIRLDYPGAGGICCEHGTFVSHLRRRARDLPGVQYVEHARAKASGGHGVELAMKRGGTQRVTAGRVVVAAGRSWGVHESPLSRRRRVSISRMAGLIADVRELPFEGYGHVIVGGPGPMLVYRIGRGAVRFCIDVPSSIGRVGRTGDWIWASYADFLPPPLREGLHEALRRRDSLRWATNAFQPRCYRTERNVARIGDAAGVFHPLTAMGITMSLLDAEALVGCKDLSRYTHLRARQSLVPELLSNAIYQAFVRADRGSEALRESIYRTWRASRRHRERTMRLLGAETTRRTEFVRAFSTVAAHALVEALALDPGSVGQLIAWLRWPGASLHPVPSTIRWRSVSWAAPESWAVGDFGGARHALQEEHHAN